MSALPYPTRSSARHGGAVRRPAALAVALALVIGGVTPLALATPAAAAPVDFTTSFEPAETVTPFANQVEVSGGVPVQSNVRGEALGSVVPSISAVTASGQNAPGEAAIYAADRDAGSKWLVFTNTAWLQYKLNQSLTVVSYSLTSGGDAPERDPKNWTVSGSTDGTNWTVVDTRTDQTWQDSQRGVRKDFTVATPGTYSYYKLDITANHSGGIIQLADFNPYSSEGAGTGAAPITTVVGAGPSAGYNMKARAGVTGTHSLKYAGEHTAAGRGFATNRLFDTSIPVVAGTRLSYKVFPEFTGNDLQYPSTYVAIDLHFTDGSTLSSLSPLDSYGIDGTARGQGAGKILYTNQWNSVKIDAGTLAAGKTVDRVLLSYDNDGASAGTAFQGWIDDVKVEANPVTIDGSSLTNYVDTRRGTNSSGSFSRGSNEAITSTPNGFNFLVPVTNAMATSREYSYQQDNDDQNRTRFEGLAVSHEPSPWMGDRNQFSVMPVAGSAAPSGNSRTRAQTFSHDNETAQPDYYGVNLDNGVKAEMTPTSHGMVMQFTYTGTAGSVVLDSPTGDGAFTIDQSTGVVTGWIDHGAGFVAGQSRMFVSGKFDTAPTATGTASGGRSLTKFATFNTGTQKTVTLRLATSLISLDQAAKNLDLEIAASSFATVRSAAKAAWNDRLGVITVDGASETEKQTLYSNLYRLNVYPNAQFENTGSNATPVYKYASPVAAKTGTATALVTNAKVSTGKMYVNNGFWDTYRTVWPAYAMLYPDVAAELVDGFTDQYRDGGWIARWSSPGYANIMTGTSSDVSFADAYLRGVDLPDALATYDAAVKNATTPSGNDNVGRKSLSTSTYLGYTPASQGESVSWATEGYINDFGIGNMAAKLAVDPKTPESRRAGLLEQSEYFLDRSTNYVNMFDPAVDFFQARNADGTFSVPADQYNPKTWWGPYTETNGWNFAFHAPHDPNGLANLYGGKAGLEAKLDEFFATPETSLGGIHEEAEARDGRYGQWGVSNQVSHHIPFIYNAAGAPAKAQKVVREALQRSYAGSDIGQGYAGDEDNGEMSAWYIFNALGFYPLQTGSTDLVLGSPLFTKATVRLAGGKSLVINAPQNSSKNIYVQSLSVNGTAHSSTTIDSNILTAGGTLDFTMGATPSAWGTGSGDAPKSLTSGSAVANPLRDTTGSAAASVTSATGENVSALVDNSAATGVTFSTPTPSITVGYRGAKQKPTFYTVTAGATPGADPSAWTVEGSNDGQSWTTVDTRSGVAFASRGELKPFKLASPATFAQFRLSVTAGGATVSLAEFELLTNGAGTETGALTFSASSGLSASSGIEKSFDLGIVSGGTGAATATVDWSDGGTPTAATVAAPSLGNSSVTAKHTYAKAGTYRATVTVTDGVATTTAPIEITVDYLEPNGLRAAFDSTCIADDGVGGNCDAKGISFPRAGLKAGGLEQGVEHGVPGTALKFTLPVVPAGQPDNATGKGQTIEVDLGEGATSLSFIGAATEKNQDTTATVNFADGAPVVIPLQFSDWTKGGNQAATAPYGNIEVVKSAYRLVGANPSQTASYFFSTVPYVIPTGRTVTSITMPTQPGEPGVEGRVHVFAIASDGTRADASFTATAGDDVTATAGDTVEAKLATVTMADASVPAPQARVQWGDASVTEDAVVTTAADGTLTIAGSHRYAAAGSYTVSITLANETATTRLTVKAEIAAVPVYATTLAVKPADGVHAGDTVHVTGDGFAANEAVEVVLATDPAVRSKVAASGSGVISADLVVPAGAEPGLYSVVATGETSKMPATAMAKVVAEVEVPVYEPQVRASASAGRVGDLVTLSGTGFAPDEKVTVVFRSDPIVVGTPTATRQGALDFSFAVPAGVEPGAHTITLTGGASNASVTLAFQVLPAALPGDGSTSGSGPTEPSAVHRLANTGADMAPALLVGGLAVLAGLVLLVVRRRRKA